MPPKIVLPPSFFVVPITSKFHRVASYNHTHIILPAQRRRLSGSMYKVHSCPDPETLSFESQIPESVLQEVLELIALHRV